LDHHFEKNKTFLIPFQFILMVFHNPHKYVYQSVLNKLFLLRKKNKTKQNNKSKPHSTEQNAARVIFKQQIKSNFKINSN